MGAMAKKDPEGAQQHGATAWLSGGAHSPKTAVPQKPKHESPGKQQEIDSLHAAMTSDKYSHAEKLNYAVGAAESKVLSEEASQYAGEWYKHLKGQESAQPKVSAPPEKPTGQLPGVQAALDSLHALGKDEHKGAEHKLNLFQATINNTHSATVKQFAQQWHDHLSATGGATGAAPVQAVKPAAAAAVQGGPQKPTGLQFGQDKVDLVHAIGTDSTTSVETKLKLLNDAKTFSVLGPVINHAQAWIDHYGAGGSQPAPGAAPELPGKPTWTVGKKGDKTKFYDDLYAQAAAMAQQGNHAGIATLYSPSAPMSANKKQWADVKAKLIEHGMAVAAPKAAAALAATVPAASPAPATTAAPVKPTGLGKQTQSEVDYVHEYATSGMLHATKVKELQGVVSEPWTDEAKAHAQAWLDHWNALPAKPAQASVSAPPAKPTGLLPKAQGDVDYVHSYAADGNTKLANKLKFLHIAQSGNGYGPEAQAHAKAWLDHLHATNGATGAAPVQTAAAPAKADHSVPPTKPTGLLPKAQVDVDDVHDTMLTSKTSAKTKLDWLHVVQRSEGYEPEAKAHAKAWEDHLKATTGWAASTTAPDTDIGSASMPVAAPAAAMAHGPAVGTPKPEKYVVASKANASNQKHFDAIHAKGESGDKAWMQAKVEELTTKVAGGKANSYVVAQLKKANEWMAHFQTGGQQAAATPQSPPPTSTAPAQAQPPHTLKLSEVPPPPDFANWNGPGKGLSSNAGFNASNDAEVKTLHVLAIQGDVAGIRSYQVKSPSKHVKAYQDELMQAFEEAFTPASHFTVHTGSGVGWDELSKQFPAKGMGSGVKGVPVSQKVGEYIILGQTNPPSHQGKTIDVTATYIKQQKANWNNQSSATQAACSRYVQTSGARFLNTALRKGNADEKDMGAHGETHGKTAKQIAEDATKFNSDIPPGTVFYRRMSSHGGAGQSADPAAFKAMIDNLSKAKPGMILQEPGFTSASFGGGVFSGELEWKFITTPGTKGMFLYSGAGLSGEKEMLFPPNTRYAIKSVKNEGGKLRIEAYILPHHD